MSPEIELISQGLILMVVGMSSVFILLSVLVSLLNASALFFDRFPLDESPAQAANASTTDDDLQRIAVALAAIHRSRG